MIQTNDQTAGRPEFACLYLQNSQVCARFNPPAFSQRRHHNYVFDRFRWRLVWRAFEWTPMYAPHRVMHWRFAPKGFLYVHLRDMGAMICITVQLRQEIVPLSITTHKTRSSHSHPVRRFVADNSDNETIAICGSRSEKLSKKTLECRQLCYVHSALTLFCHPRNLEKIPLCKRWSSKCRKKNGARCRKAFPTNCIPSRNQCV